MNTASEIRAALDDFEHGRLVRAVAVEKDVESAP
jgi:hypothetical protein